MSLFSAQRMRGDLHAHEEVFEGVIVERRKFLRISLTTLIALAANFSQRGAAQRANIPQSLSWVDLIERVTPLAQQLVTSSSPDEEAHLFELSGLIQRLNAVPRGFFDLARPVATHESLRDFPLLVLQFRLAPGAAIPYHDHRDYIGVLTVTGGAIRIRSFEMVEAPSPPPRDSTFQIRETSDYVLTTGAQSTLSRTRGNIHDLRAGPEGARFIDFFTMFRADAHSTYLNVSGGPRDPSGRIFDARWA